MAQDDTKAKPAKNKAGNKKVSKPKNYLSTIMGAQISIIVLGTIILLASLHFISAAQMKSSMIDTRLSMLSGSANAIIQQSFNTTQTQLEKLTHNDDIYNAIILQDMIEISDLENRFINNFGHAKSLKIVPWSELGTAGIKQMGISLKNTIETMMITKAADRELEGSEVYQVEKQWLVSFAAPVIHNDKTVGVLLLSLSDDFLTSNMTQDVFKTNGGLKVTQAKKQVLSVGTANSPFQTSINAPFDGGKIQVFLEQQQATSFDQTFFIIYAIAGAIGLSLIAAPIIGFLLANKSMTSDVNAIKQFINQSMGLHEGKRPNFKLLPFEALMDDVISLINKSSKLTAEAPLTVTTSTEGTISTFSSTTPTPAPIAEEITEFTAPQVFKEYDIRGLVSTELTSENVLAIARAIGSEVLSTGHNKIVVGHDARDSSAKIAEQLINGIHSTGCDTISIGQALSPTLYFATNKLTAGNGIMVTGSHLDDDYNGFKIVINQQTLLGDQIQGLLQRIQSNDFEDGAGSGTSTLINNDYTQEIAGDIITARGLKIVIDNCNEDAAHLASQLLHENDCDLVNITSTGDNQASLMAKAISEQQADFGIAFDSDADRLIVFSNVGQVIDSDKLIMLFAQDISSRNPGSSVVFDVKCSRELGNMITQAGSRPVMYKTGHSNIKAKMTELDAIFAGEYTGHFYFKDRWYGFDDGIYAAMRLAELISSSNESLDERLQTLPQTATSPEYIIPTSSHEKKHEIVSYIANAMESQQGEKITIDGFRIEFEAGWGLVRASNTSQAITLRFEAKNEELLSKLQTLFKAGLSKADPNLVVPF